MTELIVRMNAADKEIRANNRRLVREKTEWVGWQDKWDGSPDLSPERLNRKDKPSMHLTFYDQNLNFMVSYVEETNFVEVHRFKDDSFRPKRAINQEETYGIPPRDGDIIIRGRGNRTEMLYITTLNHNHVLMRPISGFEARTMIVEKGVVGTTEIPFTTKDDISEEMSILSKADEAIDEAKAFMEKLDNWKGGFLTCAKK